MLRTRKISAIFAMLCATCISIFQTNPGTVSFPTIGGQHHTNIADVEAAAQQGCYLCSELILDYNYEEADRKEASSLSFELKLQIVSSPSGRLGVLSFDSADDRLASASYEIVYTEPIDIPSRYDDFLHKTREDLSKEPWRVRNDGFASSQEPVPDSTGDPKVLKVAEGWLHQCLKKHRTCEHSEFSSSAPWYPKRLLDLSNSGQRLILTEDEEPQERYATLSHCWGTNPSICCLTADNIHEMRNDIPTELLTKTFRDAVAATRMLNIRYLWIDSLCIMQAGPGSKEDWQDHANAMRLVYTNSLINIAAARAESSADGAFTPRTDTFLRPCHVLWKWPSNFHDYAADAFWTIRKAGRHQSFGIRTLPLYTRGWVVQERFLAPRVLHFGKDRIWWECKELSMVEESYPEGFKGSCAEYESITTWPFDLNNDLHDASATDGTVQIISDPVWARWQEMINEYTRCNLSFPEKDIFVALAGIAEKFGEHYGHQYVAGSFRQHLPFDLLWQNKGERSDEYRAPSWSWASIDGQVHFAVGDCPYCDECCNRYATVKDTHIELLNDNFVYGPVRRVELILTSYLLPCRIEPVPRTGTGLRQRAAIYPRVAYHGVAPPGPVSREDPSIFWGEADIDDEDDSLRGFSLASHFTAWVLPILEFKVARGNAFGRHWGLLVKKDIMGNYARLGIYRVRDAIMDRISTDHEQQDVILV